MMNAEGEEPMLRYAQNDILGRKQKRHPKVAFHFA